MKLPKTLLICGKKRKITYSPVRADGECDLTTGDILVGTLHKNELGVLMHEVCELILYEHGHRYERYSTGNDGLLFSMDHHGMERVVQDIVYVIEQLGVK